MKLETSLCILKRALKESLFWDGLRFYEFEFAIIVYSRSKIHHSPFNLNFNYIETRFEQI